MQHRGTSGVSPAWLAAGIVLALLAAGCKGSGIAGSFFGGSGGSFGSSFEGTLGGVVVGGDGTLDLASVATVHSPEPGSLAVFGGGFAALALWRRRRSKVQAPSRS